jgi:hypothetical protein
VEAQLRGVRGQAHVDGQDPKLLQDLEQAALGRDRERDDEKIDGRSAAEGDQLVDVAEKGIATRAGAEALAAPVVEDAADANVGAGAFERCDDALAGLASAEDDGAAHEPALLRPMVNDARHRVSERYSGGEARHVPEQQPATRELGARLEQEDRSDEKAHRRGPGDQQARGRAQGGLQRARSVEIEALRCQSRCHRRDEDRRDVAAVLERLGEADPSHGERETEGGEGCGLGEADEPCDDDGRDAATRIDGAHCAGEGRGVRDEDRIYHGSTGTMVAGLCGSQHVPCQNCVVRNERVTSAATFWKRPRRDLTSRRAMTEA